MRSKYITMSHDMLGYKNQNTSRSAWKPNVDNAMSEKVSCFVIFGCVVCLHTRLSVKICFLDFAFKYNIILLN